MFAAEVAAVGDIVVAELVVGKLVVAEHVVGEPLLLLHPEGPLYREWGDLAWIVQCLWLNCQGTEWRPVVERSPWSTPGTGGSLSIFVSKGTRVWSYIHLTSLTGAIKFSFFRGGGI